MTEPIPTDPEKQIAAVSTDDEVSSLGKGDILQQEHVDPVLTAKIHLVNNAIDEIGFTGYHWKLFILNGFGYAVDSLILLIQSIIAGQAALEFHPSYKNGLTIAAYVGMLTGAIFWGLSADIVGRKFAFNVSLVVCSIFAIAAGASPTWEVLGLFVALSSFGGGGNLVLDTTVFLEYLPGSRQWMLTLMAAWWGIGQLVAGFLAWAFIPNFSCSDPSLIPSAAPCTYTNNKGWRYVWYTSGTLVFVMSIARITIIRLQETPKFLVSEGRDAECVATLQAIATKHNRPCTLTLATMTAAGTLSRPPRPLGWKAKFSLAEISPHLNGLFSTRRIATSTALIWLSWLLIGLAYPLYNVFLPAYLASRGAVFGQTDAHVTWRNYALVNFSGIWGPVLAAGLGRWKALGRKGTMVVGAGGTAVFFFAYTAVRSERENVGLACAGNFWGNVYYGTLYAYTPEVLPSAHRGTGNGLAVSGNRVMGILSAVIATVADTSTPVPIYICAALYVVMAGVAAVFPFEPYGKRSS
ncbi:membrane transporter [Massarina eburnea CBS 473.64]|uniref:Membrane transporter n=1 Tax=Massarina eburnea CBS 473.64 TaxID=1395130 RepID=A0A6A6S9E0_9PLEO|nr:membrane transporter [Massarina eburnea CBS 473.64]